ncbi:BaiN/RdsA family NAD(P)/FAD-dependent oxidoreductase [Novipirellula artificiosorum]|uniref:Tricarballylate dehydrogenase n=1 Tax=Novipirellula artificiosorum TaxID=2528016 RepID=A0A5C6DWI0_9BACT|nr:NAD(P)/FAD-dependent oxidoreductase [Novipirellula artificiosorum]TWU40705.1 hypothetical protein Poly41_15400 [Novipirellula artificiosorum]
MDGATQRLDSEIQERGPGQIHHHKKIVIIGAGAAGLIAAAAAAKRSAEVVLLEKNSKTGAKILMSGGTRCNVTQDTDARGILTGFGHAARFLQRSVGAFPPHEVVRMFAELGVATKVESTGKVFPQSDRAIEVRDALERQAVDAGVKILRKQSVHRLLREPSNWWVETEQDRFSADRVIVTSGGRSWPACGTTGDAYGWLQQLGHTLIATRPALVPLTGGDRWTHELSGITLDDCIVTAKNHSVDQKKHQMARRASWLFTHFGFSGPAAMDISRIVTLNEDRKRLQVTLDVLPDRSAESIETTLVEAAAVSGARKISSLLSDWLPSRFATALALETCADPAIAELSRLGRRTVVSSLKALPLPITGTRGFAKAEVTAGGVSLNEVNPRTMESKIVPGLYIAGEVLDVDGWIGGYNFQAAFSTGRAAGIAAASP